MGVGYVKRNEASNAKVCGLGDEMEGNFIHSERLREQ